MEDMAALGWVFGYDESADTDTRTAALQKNADKVEEVRTCRMNRHPIETGPTPDSTRLIRLTRSTAALNLFLSAVIPHIVQRGFGPPAKA